MQHNRAIVMRAGGEYDQLLVAVYSSPEKRLHHLSNIIWRSYANGAMPDEAADLLNEAIARRREFFRARRQVGAANRRCAAWRVDHPRDTAIKKRRMWSTGGALPSELRSMFTPGEMAVAGVIRAEVQRKGRCTLPYKSIAKAAGLRSTTVVKRFIRQAKKHHLVRVEERFGDRGLNRPNVITIISEEWLSWISYQDLARQGGTNVPTNQSPRREREKVGATVIEKKALERKVAGELARTRPSARAGEERGSPMASDLTSKRRSRYDETHFRTRCACALDPQLSGPHADVGRFRVHPGFDGRQVI